MKLEMTIDGIDSIDEDFDKFLPNVNKAVTAGLKTVLSDFQESLASHVQTDVYAAYKPLDYVRSGAMGDKSNMTGAVNGNTLKFEYTFPTEMTENYGLYFAESDDVIKAIQDSNYLWNVGNMEIPERPFWDNFVTEQLIGGQAEKSLVNGMNSNNKDLHATATGETYIDSEDTYGELHGDPTGAVKWRRIAAQSDKQD